jgi:hypothetical protein
MAAAIIAHARAQADDIQARLARSDMAVLPGQFDFVCGFFGVDQRAGLPGLLPAHDRDISQNEEGHGKKQILGRDKTSGLCYWFLPPALWRGG